MWSLPLNMFPWAHLLLTKGDHAYAFFYSMVSTFSEKQGTRPKSKKHHCLGESLWGKGQVSNSLKNILFLSLKEACPGYHCLSPRSALPIITPMAGAGQKDWVSWGSGDRNQEGSTYGPRKAISCPSLACESTWPVLFVLPLATQILSLLSPSAGVGMKLTDVGIATLAKGWVGKKWNRCHFTWGFQQTPLVG